MSNVVGFPEFRQRRMSRSERALEREVEADLQRRLDEERRFPLKTALIGHLWDVLSSNLRVADDPWRTARIEDLILRLDCVQGVDIVPDQDASIRRVVEEICKA